jgi:hypothetical protein
MIDLRPLLRPFPLFLVLLFAAVAIVDLVHSLRETPEQPPALLRTGIVRFEELNPVIDLRPQPPDPEVVYQPEPELVGRKWSQPERRGVWATNDGAALKLDVEVGGHRVMILDCLPAGGKRPIRRLAVKVNGRRFGPVNLAKGWGRYRVVLPKNAIRPGSNRIVFEFPDANRARLRRRYLLVRRLGLFLDESVDDDAVLRRHPVSVDMAEGAVSFFASGTLEVPFTVDARIDALKLRYRFNQAGGRAEVVVGRPQGSGVGRDADFHCSVSADRKLGGRIRIPLHGRRGGFVFNIRVDLNPQPARLNLTSLGLVKEDRPARPRPETP